MSQELRSPQSNNHNWQPAAHDEIAAIYASQSDVFSDNPRVEQIVSVESKRLFDLASELAEARTYRLETQFFTHEQQRKSFVSSVAKVLFNRAIPIGRIEPLTEDHLRSQESAIGATVFGEIAPNERREFFYDRRIDCRDSWFFHQEIIGQEGRQEVTLHYEVHPNGILRISSNPDTKNEFISGQELEDFLLAADIYHGLVMSGMYNTDRSSSKKAA